MHTFGLSLNGGPEIIIRRPAYVINDLCRYEVERRSSNYAVFDGLSGNLTIA